MASPREKKRRRLSKPPKRGPVTVAFDGLRYRMGEYSLRGFVALLPRLPAGALSALTAAVSRATLGVLRRYPDRMERNIALAMGPELPSRKERMAVVRRAWRNFAQCVLETMRLMDAPKDRIVAAVAIEGEEHQIRARQKQGGHRAERPRRELYDSRPSSGGGGLFVHGDRQAAARPALRRSNGRLSCPRRGRHDFRQAAARGGAGDSQGVARESCRAGYRR